MVKIVFLAERASFFVEVRSEFEKVAGVIFVGFFTVFSSRSFLHGVFLISVWTLGERTRLFASSSDLTSLAGDGSYRQHAQTNIAILIETARDDVFHGYDVA